MGKSLSRSPLIRFGGRSPGPEACSAVTSPRGAGSALCLSSSEAPQSPRYPTVAPVGGDGSCCGQVKIDWPAEEHAASEAITSSGGIPVVHPSPIASSGGCWAGTSSSYREAQKESVATRAPPHWDGSLSRICGPSFRLRDLPPSSPDRHGPGEERVTPHYTVSVSPQCPQEINLPTLPEFQGAAVSSECFSLVLLHGNIAELRGSPPLQGFLEQLVRSSPAGPPLQGTELTALSIPETSLGGLLWGQSIPITAKWSLRAL